MTATIEVKKRNEFTRSYKRMLRESGNIPAIIYGKGINSTPIFISKNDFLNEIKEVGRNGILSVQVNGKQQKVVVTEYQDDPLTKEILHIDFLAVDENTEINAEIRIHLSGDAIGVLDGGLLSQALHDLSITAKATEIPEAITIDISHLKVGDTITVGDIRKQYPFEIHNEDIEVICSILPPKQEEEISTGEEQEPGIPENLEGREESPEQ